MATGVGLRIAADESVAAVLTSEPHKNTAAEPILVVRPTELYMSDEGDTTLGEEPAAGYRHRITGFVSAVGDAAGVTVDDGPAYRGEDLVATALFCLINLTTDHLAGPAEFYAAHPTDWTPEQVQALREALDYLGLRSVVLISDADVTTPRSGVLAADVDDEQPVSSSTVAQAAAQAALDAVLATPAGVTPPDPTHSETALQVTDVLPALDRPQPLQAYSVASDADTPADPALPVESAPAPTRRRRTPLLVTMAALVGILLGGGLAIGMLADRAASPPPATHARQNIPPDPRPSLPTSTVRSPVPETTPAAPPVTSPPDTPDTPDTPAPAPVSVEPPPPPPPPAPPTTTPSPSPTTTPQGQIPPRSRYPYPYDPYNPYGPYNQYPYNYPYQPFPGLSVPGGPGFP